MPAWFNDLIKADDLQQLLAFVVVFFLSVLLTQYLKRVLKRSEAHLLQNPERVGFSLLTDGITILRRSLHPLIVWALLQIAAQIFILLDWDRRWLEWAIPIAFIWFAYRLFSAFLTTRIEREKADLWIKRLLRPILILFVTLYSLDYMDDILNFGIRLQDANITVGTLIAGIAIVFLFFYLGQASRKYLDGTLLPQAGVAPALSQALSTITSYIIIVMGVMMGMNVVGIDLTALAVVAGGLSVGIGFGLQEIFTNFLSGFILLFEQSVSPGDVVQLGDYIGRVQEVGFRSMRIITPDNVELIVPNSSFVTDIVTNYTRSDHKVRIQIPIGVSYNADPREVEQALLAAAYHDWILKEPPPEVEFADFDESSLLFELEVWTDNPFDKKDLTSDLRYQMWEELQKRNIEVPFPQQDVHIRSFPTKKA